LELSASRIVYGGPISVKGSAAQADYHTIVLPQTQFITSTAAGVIATVISSSPSGAPDWTGLAGVYDEFRVLGFKNTYFPNNRYSKVTVTCRPGYSVSDRADATALSSYSDAVSFSSRVRRSLEDPWTHTLRMASTEEAQFIPSATPTAKMWIKLYFDGLTINTEYGLLETVFLVQFRGKR